MTRSSPPPSPALLPGPPRPSPTPAARSAAGPGWFDSSWDLRRGLDVQEGGQAQARLHAWIDDFLGGQPGASAEADGVSAEATRCG